MSAAAAVAGFFMAWHPSGVADYAHDAGPTLHPLIAGDLHGALGHQPAMGWFSILLRAPVAFFARHASALVEYRVGSLPCVFVLAALGVWLAVEMRERRSAPWLACVTVLALAVLGPMNWHALGTGHPEELLGAALCVAAVLTAASGRSPIAAGLLLGVALATKQWAILAAGPALLVAPRGRAQIAAIGIGVAAALTFIPVLAGSHHLLSPASTVSRSTTTAQPASIWWPLGHVDVIRPYGWPIERRVIPMWIANVSHPSIVVIGVVLPLALFAKARRYAISRESALTLLALLLLLRCLLDPMTIGYYNLPLLIALLALEALHRRGLPLLSLVSNLVLWYLVVEVPWGLEPGRVAAIYLAWALPLTAYLGAKLYAPSVISGLGKWLSTSLPSSVTTTRSSMRTPNAPGT
jgi:Glycosyltransferase family 87